MKTKRILSMLLALMMLLGTFTAGMTVSAENTTYSDVTEDMWSYGDIVYVSEKGLMNGTGGSTFSPAVDVTRSMVVTVLYRMEGSPAVNFDEYAYADVASGEFYSDAVIWAKNVGIVTSVGQNENYEDLFAPTRAITRQELATMFVRYAEYRYVITDKQADISSFKDIADVADWASKAMAWCNAAGLIKGTGNGDTLSPKMTATREQFAAIIHRFDTADFEYQYILKEPKPLSTFTEPEYPLVNDADLYVAVDGSDSNPGTFEKPLATFEKAVAKVRELKKTAKDGIVVAFKAGDYGNLQLELTELDAGSESCPITYCKYGDGDVLFSNGVTAYIDEFEPIDESDYYLFPEKSHSLIKKADMSDKQYIGELNGMSPLFSEEERIEMARFPNQNQSGKDMSYTIAPEGSYPTADGSIGYGAWTVPVNSAIKRRFDGYHSYENIAIIGCVGHEYDGDYLLVSDYNKETGEITMVAQDTVYGFGSMGGLIVYYMNVSEELDYEGEYWFNPETETLYVYDPTYTRYTLATGGTFLKIDGADYTSFVGLDFSYCTEDAIIVNADNVTLDNTRVVGSNGAYFAVQMNGYNNKIVNSDLSHLAAGGVVVGGGDFEFLTPTNTLVDNNVIHDYGQIHHTWTAGVRIHDGVGVTVSHNEIYNAPHLAIMFATIWDRSIGCIFEYNYVHDVLNSWYGDMGAIYCGRLHTDRDNIVRYNLISNIRSGGAWSVYIDDGMSGQQFYGNVFYNPSAYAFLHSGGRDNVIQDNVIIRGGDSNDADSQPLRVWAKWAEMIKADGYVTSGNWTHLLQLVPQYLPKDPEALKLWQEEWPELFKVYDHVNSKPMLDCVTENLNEYYMMANSAGCVIKNNYSFGFSNTEHWLLDPHENKFNEFKNNPIWGEEAVKGEGDAPHIFVNPAQGDYTIREDCTLEFEYKVDFSKIGRY
ncbi:MAG: S-layer homology domain-containing protein [Clostridia bacterium]|nr:S-layer homology domain-containing protein [Clostridia bacterium]